MRYDFNADEIFEMAEQIERNGSKFYRDAAEHVSDPEGKKLLLELADMEDEHEKTFASLRASLTSKDKEGTVFDPNNEAGMYLKALADTKVFFEKKIDMTSMKEILKDAIVAEKDSIVFYLGMKEMVPEEKGKQKLEHIIKEEMKHIRMLSKELVALPQ